MSILASIGILSVASLFTLILIYIFDRYKNKRALRDLRIGDEIKDKGGIITEYGVVVQIYSTSQEVVLLCSSGGRLFRTVKPGDFIKTGFHFTVTELNEYRSDYRKKLYKEADELLNSYTAFKGKYSNLREEI
ncbi:preprotein translocase subunit YajC [Listeria monocytogenes]|uniref:preprotein translocase subunit YajC n=1 Tax=Listeria monocytogenes TaxID=1639 RepID=UPI000BDF994D|nr:preprotein translocase subunit YajC [Listeria monocytogenes]EAD0548002.1 preprotein translocase subunit YajC [Listeria monocytogenes]EAD0559987.1 preprotein translocase subunit YajC [Listeria monocytogenes]EJV7779777.1 preprotein translocase subunit YajC [Listeria monocytogenes]PCW98379.1 preprotein translocase subunit YajC [Listeria monocytogenes]PDC02415.1 preprotein translocase subunit YajC [Listeria monocytogenes]